MNIKWRKERNAGGHYVYPYRIRRVNEDGSVRDIGECWHLEDARLIAAAPELLAALSQLATSDVFADAASVSPWLRARLNEMRELLDRIEGKNQ